MVAMVARPAPASSAIANCDDENKHRNGLSPVAGRNRGEEAPPPLAAKASAESCRDAACLVAREEKPGSDDRCRRPRHRAPSPCRPPASAPRRRRQPGRERCPASPAAVNSTMASVSTSCTLWWSMRAGREDADEVERRAADHEDGRTRPVAANRARDAHEQRTGRGRRAAAARPPARRFRRRHAARQSRNRRMIAAIGASTSLDQCMTKPPSSPMRYWCRSNQP